jgi:hypothetical protein
MVLNFMMNHIVTLYSFVVSFNQLINHFTFVHRMASNSNRGQGGIQQLLAAEQEAQRIVNAAKNGICSFHFYHVCPCS